MSTEDINTSNDLLNIRMDGDTDIERLHNRLNPPGVMAQAYAAFGGQNTGYFYSGEDAFGKFTDAELVNPEVIAKILSTDGEKATAALRLLDSVEDFESHPQVDLLSVEVSQEDLAGNSLKALKTIFNWSKAIAKNVFDDMTNYELVARYLEFKAENLRVTARDRRQSTLFSNKPLLINTRIANLAVRYEPVRDIPSLITSLRVMQNLVRDYYSYNDEGLLRMADRIPGLFNDPEGLQVALNQVSPAKLFTMNSFRPSSTQDRVYQSMHILGCHRVSVKAQDSSGPLDRRYSVRLVPSDDAPRPLPKEFEFKRFPISTMDQVLHMVAEQARYLQQINTPMIRQRRIARLERIAVLSQRLSREIESGQFDPDKHRHLIALINQYNDWVVNPYKELYGLVCRNLRAVLNVCEINAM